MSKITEKWLQRSNLYCTQLVLWLLQESNCSTIDYRTKQGVLFVYDMKRKCGFTESCKKMVRLVALQTCSLTNISTHWPICIKYIFYSHLPSNIIFQQRFIQHVTVSSIVIVANPGVRLSHINCSIVRIDIGILIRIASVMHLIRSYET